MKNHSLFKIIYFTAALLIAGVILYWGRNDRTVRLTQENLEINESTTDYYTRGILLHKGTYRISVFYASDADVRMDFFGTENDNYIDALPVSMYGNTFENEYTLSKDSQGAKLRFEIPEGCALYISDIEISGRSLLNNDSILFAVLTLVILAAVYLFIDKRLYKGMDREQAAAYLMMAAAVALVFAPHMSGRLGNGNDLGGHLIRLEGVKDAMLDGQFPVVLFPRTLGEYGELGAMYPYLFLVLPALLRILNISLLTVYDLTVLSICIAVVAVMYRCMRITGLTRFSSAMTAVAYLAAPAFIHGATDNGAILGTGFAYIFIPVALTGLCQVLSGRTDRWVMLTIGFTGMLQGHLVTTLLMIPCCVFIAAVLTVRGLREHRIKTENYLCIIKAGLWCIPLNIWWIAIFIYYYINGDLYIGALGETFSGLDTAEFLALEATRYSFFCIGITVLIMIVCCIMTGRAGSHSVKSTKEQTEEQVVKRTEEQTVKHNAERTGKQIAEQVGESGLREMGLYYAGMYLVLSCILLLACTRVIPWEALRNISAIKFFTNTMQFPYRFYTAIAACLAVALGISIDRFIAAVSDHKAVLQAVLTVVIAVAGFTCNYGYVKEYCSPDNVTLTRILGDISPYKQREYLPDGTGDEYYLGRTNITVSDEERIVIDGYEKREDRAAFNYIIDEGTENAYAELPMFYYPGYKAELPDGTGLLMETGEDNHMRVWLPESGSGQRVNIRFRVMPAFSVLTVISICAAVVFIKMNLTGRTRRSERDAETGQVGCRN